MKLLFLLASTALVTCYGTVDSHANQTYTNIRIHRQLGELNSTDENLLGGCNDPKQVKVVAYVLMMIVCFYGIAIICDEHFEDVLEQLSKKYHLSEDVAGATFMAIGSSAPELATSLVDTFYFKNNVGVGTIVGSAIFNLLVIIGASAWYSISNDKVDWRPITRDLTFYVSSVLLMIGFSTSMGTRLVYNVDGHPGEFTGIEGILLLGLYLIYIGVMRYNESVMKCLGNPPQDTSTDVIEKNPVVPPQTTTRNPITYDLESGKESSETSSDDTETKNIDVDETDDQPSTNMITYMWGLVFKSTIPDCSTEPVETFTLWRAFSVITLWISLLSWILVFCVSCLGCIFGVNPVVMAVTVIAVGTSVPDALMSIEAAKRGEADMAVANAIGSNIFDICVGLGLPAALSPLLLHHSTTILNDHMSAHYVWLVISLGILVVDFKVYNWTFSKSFALILMLTYVVFAAYSIVYIK